MDGLDLLLKVRSDLPAPIPPIVLCSGFDLTEEEALRRGATHFLRKPVEAGDLLSIIGEVLAGRAIAAEVTASHRDRAAAARQLAYAKARGLLERIGIREGGHLADAAFEHVSGLAHYLGVTGVALALLKDERLRVVAASKSPVLARDTDLGEVLPAALAIIETGSALVLPDALAHPSFGIDSRQRQGIRCFVGVPVVVDQVSIGVLCVAATEPVDVQPEDLSLLRLFSELGRRR